MSGTLVGGKKAAITNKQRYGIDFYANIGKLGGMNGHTGGFASNPALASIAGQKGGKISKRGKSNKSKEMIVEHRSKINEMLADGKSVKEISQRLGIPVTALYKALDGERELII